MAFLRFANDFGRQLLRNMKKRVDVIAAPGAKTNVVQPDSALLESAAGVFG